MPFSIINTNQTATNFNGGAPGTAFNGVSTIALTAGNAYDYLGAWNPNTIYKAGVNGSGGASQFEIVEYQGSFWLANYYNVDQNPTQSGTYGAWYLITNDTAANFPGQGGNYSGKISTGTVTISNYSGANYNLSTNSVGVPYSGESAPVYDPGNPNSVAGPNPNPAVPFPVTNLGAGYTSSSSVELFWTASAVYGVGNVSGYSVYEMVTNPNGTKSTSLLGTTSSTTFGVSGLDAGSQYTFQVVASDAVGNSGATTSAATLITNQGNTISENPVAPGTAISDSYTSTSTGTQYDPAHTLYSSKQANPTVTITTGSAGQSAQHFSPYLDMTLPGVDLLSMAQASGLHNFTLAFMQTDKSDYTITTATDGSGDSTYALKANVVPNMSLGGLGGLTPESTAVIAQEVRAVVAAGGTVAMSIGGYTGADPAVIATQYAANLQNTGYTAAQALAMATKQLQTELQSVINTFGVNHLDFDIENDTPTGGGTNLVQVVNNSAANSIRDAAVKALQAANPGLSVSYTLAVTQEGLSDGSRPVSSGPGSDTTSPQNQLALLKLAAQDGVKLSAVNLMAMDYYDSTDDNGANSINGGSTTVTNGMFDVAKKAAQVVEGQIQAIAAATPGWTPPLIGITPMAGQNDSPKEVFSLADASALAAWASQQSYITSLGMWELPRDQSAETQLTAGTNNSPGATADTTGVPKSAFQFSHILAGVESYTPTSAGGVVTFSNAAAVTYNPVLSGSGSLVIQGAGAVTLTSAQTFTGKTQISGELDLSGSAVLNQNKAVTLKAAGAVFDISGATVKEAILNLAGVAGSFIRLGDNTLKINDSTSATFSGVISDGGVAGGTGGALIVKGTGASLNLTGANTFTGGVTLQTGTLELGTPTAAGVGHALTFTGVATLQLDAGALGGSGTQQNYGTAITGFAAGDHIDLASLAYVSGATATYSGGYLTVTSGANHVSLTLSSSHVNDTFTATNDGLGHVLVGLVGG